MATNVSKKINLPQSGFVNELASLTGSTRVTVWRALRKNSPGKKADTIRRLYLAKYGNQNN